jgi:hypothetical protein
MVYPSSVFVPNVGLSLKIFGEGFALFAAHDLNTPILTIDSTIGYKYEVNSPKNSINGEDYILGPVSGNPVVKIFFEVG